MRRLSESLRRPFEAVLAIVLLALLSPILLLIAVAVRITMGSPIFYRQERAGLGGRPFVLLKFRSMTDADGAADARSDHERLTRLGRWLRSTSLDELPELWNVVRGDMSLVGPRPLPVTYLARYSPTEHRRHSVRPGITGWAQVNGRNSTSWDARLAMDVWYVDHRSWWLDARILARTVRTVLGRHGVSAEGHATMPELRPDARD